MMYVFLLMWNLSPYNLGVNVINFLWDLYIDDTFYDLRVA